MQRNNESGVWLTSVQSSTVSLYISHLTFVLDPDATAQDMVKFAFAGTPRRIVYLYRDMSTANMLHLWLRCVHRPNKNCSKSGSLFNSFIIKLMIINVSIRLLKGKYYIQS